MLNNTMRTYRAPSFLLIICFTIVIFYHWNVFEDITSDNQVAKTRAEISSMENNISHIINMLAKFRNGSSYEVIATDLDVGIRFLTTLRDKHDHLNNQNDVVEATDRDYFQTIEEWNTDRSDWKETFYPGAHYTGEICGERLVRTTDIYPEWPYFTFKPTCANHSADMTSKAVTILLNVVSHSVDHLKGVSNVLDGINAMYPNMQVIMAVPRGFSLVTKHNVRIIQTPKHESSGKTWNNLVKEVQTTYVFIGKDIVHFDDDCQLERLIREIPSLKMSITGGAIKTPSDGHWFNGCHQMAYKNYTLVYKSGYKHSAHDCLDCHSILGPFVAKTSILNDIKFRENMPEKVLFYDLFFRIYKKQLKIGVCPDAMLLVRDEVVTSLNRSQWLPMATRNGLNKIVSTEGETFTYTCEESKVDGNYRKGFGTAPCKLQKLADHIKFVMKMCRENNILCVTNAGTTVGALKLNSVLPWEKDADILYYSKNTSAVKNLITLFQKGGYTLHQEKAKNFQANIFHTFGSGWKIDIYPFPESLTEKLKYRGEKPTKIFFDGDWIEVPRNVGRQIRDRYGPEIYKHVQHSSELNKQQFTVRTGYKWTGHFTKCPRPGAHNCLDVNTADGNLQFGDPIP